MENIKTKTDSLEKTNREIEMFGRTIEDIKSSMASWVKLTGEKAAVASMLSDMQEELTHDNLDKEAMRQKMNVMKYILFTDINK